MGIWPGAYLDGLGAPGRTHLRSEVALWSADGDALAVSWHELHGLDAEEVLAWAAERAQGRTSVIYVGHRDRDGLGLIRLAGTDPSASDVTPGVFHVFGDDR